MKHIFHITVFTKDNVIHFNNLLMTYEEAEHFALKHSGEDGDYVIETYP